MGTVCLTSAKLSFDVEMSHVAEIVMIVYVVCLPHRIIVFSMFVTVKCRETLNVSVIATQLDIVIRKLIVDPNLPSASVLYYAQAAHSKVF